jgi:anaerobic glycerol-3-phosphate dehydrogenase
MKDINEIDARVTNMSNRAHENGTLLSDDPEFKELVEALMEANQDDLMVLLGAAITETDALPNWLTEGLQND